MTSPPTVAGYFSALSSGAIPANIDITSIPDGAWMIATQLTIANIDAPPAGWTTIIAGQVIGTRIFSVAARIKQPGDAALTWGSPSGYKRVVLAYGLGADAVSTWGKGLAGVRAGANAVGGQSVQAGGTLTSVAPSMTVSVANSLVFALFFEATTNLGAAPSITAGLTQLFNVGGTDTTANIEQVTGAYSTPGTGATPVYTATYDQTQASNGGAIQLALTPKADVVEPGLPSLDGKGNVAKVFYKNAAGVIRTPRAIVPIPDGYKSVDDMLSHREFYWSHRGGSGSYPEHALWSYTQSVIRRFGGLEVSLARSSDGVWFGLHDQDINRSSGVTGQPNANAMTWAQIQTYQIVIGATGAPRPYMRIEQILNAYGKSHVLILDPKYEVNNTSALLDVLKAFYGTDAEANKHVIMKSYGVGSGGFRNTVVSRGFKTWGYFYHTDSTGYVTNAPNWDIIGLNFDADQSYWDQLMAAAPGKRVVAHILPTNSSVVQARAKGATGFQCAGVAQISPDNS